MRPLKLLRSVLCSAVELPRRASPRTLARVEQLLRRDAAGALPGLPPGFSQRVAVALRASPLRSTAQPSPPADRAGAPAPCALSPRPRFVPAHLALVGAGLAAALVLAVLGSSRGPARAFPGAGPPLQGTAAALTAPPAASTPPFGLGLERLRPRSESGAAAALDARLLAEARLLAADGARVARALGESLPRPPRRSSGH